ncbi:MAG TPA: hypothetical protein VJU82_17835 [Acidobacteriaceae bacterium]|nr:hypothetical protein [Acidobacteriaceae bacterium]
MRRIPPALLRASTTAVVMLALAIFPAIAAAQTESCTTQSALAPAERNAIADTARRIASAVVANDAATLRTAAAPELAKDFGALQYLVGTTAPKLAGDSPVVDQVYVLDATKLKTNPDGSSPEAQFYCSLNRTQNEVEFDIPSLPPGRYAFAIVNLIPASASGASWHISFLLRQQPASSGPWLLAGLYPRPLTAAGHDGLWYWRQARQMVKDKQPWNAWLYYQLAQRLLAPADFVLSTHLDKLRTEASGAAPPALSEGVSPDAPLVVKGTNGTEYHFTVLSTEETVPTQPNAPPALDVAVHYPADPLPDQAAARQRNLAAAAALLTDHPELRKQFHGVSVYADQKGQPPFATAFSMAEIH